MPFETYGAFSVPEFLVSFELIIYETHRSYFVGNIGIICLIHAALNYPVFSELFFHGLSGTEHGRLLQIRKATVNGVIALHENLINGIDDDIRVFLTTVHEEFVSDVLGDGSTYDR